METISIGLWGGLGNMMFQIASAHSISLRDNKELICDTNNMVVPQKPYTHYIENIFRKIKFSDSIYHQNVYQEPSFDYNEIPKISGNLKLSGYFQSEKYFNEFKSEIYSIFEMTENIRFNLIEKYLNILEKETCSLHVRRGDYVGLQDAHPLPPIDYYKNAINLIGEDKHFLIFSDDLFWCKENLNFIKNKTFISNNFDYEDLYLMSMCKNNIIANSTFSWWGAWLNRHENKQVIAPNKWFGQMYSFHNTKDLYCPNWIKL